MNMDGFILLHRKIKENWIWQRADYLQWFLFMLFKANFKDNNEFLFNGNLMPIKRGQFISSYGNLAKELPKCSIKKIRTFLKLLQESKIIGIENVVKGTRITILKYDSYQSGGHKEGNQKARLGHDEGNNRKKDNKENNEKENISYPKTEIAKYIENEIQPFFNIPTQSGLVSTYFQALSKMNGDFVYFKTQFSNYKKIISVQGSKFKTNPTKFLNTWNDIDYSAKLIEVAPELENPFIDVQGQRKREENGKTIYRYIANEEGKMSINKQF